jgi:DNA-binding FrmR family transcriptional regulator
LQNVIAMIEAERSCMDITQQLHAVEKAISAAKKLVIHDDLDHCLDGMTLNGVSGIESSISEFKNITKYL